MNDVRVVVVLGYSDGAHGELHPTCAERLACAAGVTTDGDVVVLSGWARTSGAQSEAELMRADAPEGLKAGVTARTARMFEDRGRLREWMGRLRTALGADPTSKPIQDEIERVRPKLEASPARSAGPPRR